MNEEKVTFAEAIVKIQSGEWKEAVNTTGEMLRISWRHIALFYIKNGKRFTDVKLMFRTNGKPNWKEYKISEDFNLLWETAHIQISLANTMEYMDSEGRIVMCRFNNERKFIFKIPSACNDCWFPADVELLKVQKWRHHLSTIPEKL